MKTARKPRKLVCLRCEHEAFTPATSKVTQEFRGETLEVEAEVMSCNHCGWETLAPGQLDPLRQATVDAYRQRKGLLRSDEIRSIRSKLGLSQREFAKHLGVGEASIPRWESFGIQEPIYDERLRKADKGEPHQLSTGTGILFEMEFASGYTDWSQTSKIGTDDLILPSAEANDEGLFQGMTFTPASVVEWEQSRTRERQDCDTCHGAK